MSLAWETTAEDVVNVFRSKGLRLDFNKADVIMEQLDQDEIERAALYGQDMDGQTDYAYEEIEKQLKEKKFI